VKERIMIYRQGVSREEKIKFTLFSSCISIPWIVLSTILLLKGISITLITILISIFYLPAFFVFVLLSSMNFEWFCVYDDRIEAKCIWGRKNRVYFKDVLFVEDIEINLTTRGMKRRFLIFNDGRKNNSNFFDLNSCYNNKKYNLRIRKNAEVENYVKNILKIEIVRQQSSHT
jgi:hypothetical protein